MIKGYTSSQKRGPQKYATIQPLGAGKYGTEVLPKALTEVLLVDQVPEAGSTEDTIVLTGHSVKQGDILRFNGGNLDYQEVTVASVTTNTITLAHKFDQAITAADTFRYLRTVTLTISKEGNLATSSGPIQFVKDGAATQVIEDTVTPANNVPLPVKLSSVTGDINITAGDLNVQTSHLGANFDSQRIGDGTNIMGVNADLEALVHDVEVHTKLDTLQTRADLLGTEAKQDTIIAALAEQNKPKTIVASALTASVALTTADTASVTVPVGKKAVELEILYKNGENILVKDASGGNVIGRVTQGGGKIPVSLAAGVIVHISAEGGNFTATDLVVNLIGVDA